MQFFYKPHKRQKSKKHLIDTAIYPLAIISPIMTIPQLLDIWINNNVVGASLLTWGAYAMVSSVWLIYGIAHKEKPIIISSTLLCLLQSSIAAGIIVYK